jgi:hypothetical protein
MPVMAPALAGGTHSHKELTADKRRITRKTKTLLIFLDKLIITQIRPTTFGFQLCK